MLTLPAKPEPVEVDLAKSAIVVVDMQNAFASKGGLLDIANVDISGAPAVVRSIGGILDVARRAGIPVVYLQMGFKPDLSDAGGASSPNPRKELALCMMANRPELRGKLLIEGTWDFAVVDELKPQPDDIVIRKTRYSGFTNPRLDSELRSHGIQYLFFTGIATNVCVESTLRDAFFHDYWPILIADATMHAGPPTQQEATFFNVQTYFGWVTQAPEFIQKVSKRTKEVQQPLTVGF